MDSSLQWRERNPDLNISRFSCSCQEGPVAGEGGESQAPEGETAGGPEEEAGGAEGEGRETTGSTGGEAEAETGEKQGRPQERTTASRFWLLIDLREL